MVIESHPMKSLNVNWNMTRGMCCEFLHCYMMIGCGDYMWMRTCGFHLLALDTSVLTPGWFGYFLDYGAQN